MTLVPLPSCSCTEWKNPCRSMEVAIVVASDLEEAKDQEISQLTASLPVGERE